MNEETIGMQAEAEGAAAESSTQPAAGVETGDAALRHLMEDMKVPRDKAEKYLRAKSRDATTRNAAQQEAASGPAAPEAEAQGEESPAPAATTESRPSFEELIRDDEYKQQFQSKMEGIVRDRVSKMQTELSGYKEEREKLRPMLMSMAAELGLETDDPDRLNIEELVKAYRNDPNNYRKSAQQRGTDMESAMQAVNAEVDRSIMSRRINELETARRQSAQAAMQEQILTRHMERLRREEAELQKSIPDFSLEAELNNSETGKKFRDLTAPGSAMSVTDAYRLVHWEEIDRSRREEANRKAMEAVAGSVARGQQRPRENNPTAGGGTSQYVPYSQRSKAELAEMVKKAKRGEKVWL